MSIDIAPMTIADYDEVLALWQSLDGIGLHEHEDSREAIACYLDRNPGLSFVARHQGRVVGSILCGHDGRRGMINHLSVHPEYRNQVVGRSLVDLSLSQLAKVGVRRCNIVVKSDNDSGQEVWSRLGWHTRPDLVFMQKQTG